MIQYKLTDQAKQFKEQGICDCTPVRGTPLSAGMDLKACIPLEIIIAPYETVKVMTGVRVFLGGAFEYFHSVLDGSSEEEGVVDRWLRFTLAGLYLPRSSNKGLQLENTVGLLDVDYMGESFVKLYNKTEEAIVIRPGDRLVQLVVVPAILSDWEEVEEFKMMTIDGEVSAETQRGEGGDGSTGKQ